MRISGKEASPADRWVENTVMTYRVYVKNSILRCSSNRPIRSFKCVYSPKSIDYKPSPHLFAFSFPLPRFNLQQTAAAEFYSRLLRSIMFRAVLIEQLFFPDFPRI